MKKKLFVFLLITLTSSVYSQNYIVEPVITNLVRPVAFAFLPGDRVIVTQQQGLAKIYGLNNVFISDFWNFTDSTVFGSEAGLLGVCLDPDYSINHYIYFFYLHNPNTFRIVRLTENNNVGTNPVFIFNENKPIGPRHYGGNIHFGNNRKLFITIGNNGVSANTQLLTNFHGKLLRVNADGTIPNDNPFYDDGNPNTGNDDRIWSYGLRNSFDFCISPLNDSIYATENGDGNPDEVNFIRKGKNYGYPVCNGYCFPYNPQYKNPMTEIPGNNFTNYAPTGILFYTSNVMPELTNKLLVVGMGGGEVLRGLLKCDLSNAPFYDSISSKNVILDISGYTCLMQGVDGYIYALKYNYNSNPQGRLDRIKQDLSGIQIQNHIVGYNLSQNYPNPFNPVTNIKYEIPVGSFVSVKIYNSLGVQISTLVNENKKQGGYEVNWDGTNFPSGVYFYELSAGEYTERKKMVLVK